MNPSIRKLFFYLIALSLLIAITSAFSDTVSYEVDGVVSGTDTGGGGWSDVPVNYLKNMYFINIENYEEVKSMEFIPVFNDGHMYMVDGSVTTNFTLSSGAYTIGTGELQLTTYPDYTGHKGIIFLFDNWDVGTITGTGYFTLTTGKQVRTGNTAFGSPPHPGAGIAGNGIISGLWQTDFYTPYKASISVESSGLSNATYDVLTVNVSRDVDGISYPSTIVISDTLSPQHVYLNNYSVSGSHEVNVWTYPSIVNISFGYPSIYQSYFYTLEGDNPNQTYFGTPTPTITPTATPTPTPTAIPDSNANLTFVADRYTAQVGQDIHFTATLSGVTSTLYPTRISYYEYDFTNSVYQWRAVFNNQSGTWNYSKIVDGFSQTGSGDYDDATHWIYRFLLEGNKKVRCSVDMNTGQTLTRDLNLQISTNTAYTTPIKFRWYDMKTGSLIASPGFRLYDVDYSTVTEINYATGGTFTTSLRPNGNYMIESSNDGYTFENKTFFVPQSSLYTQSNPYLINIEGVPEDGIVSGQTLICYIIYDVVNMNYVSNVDVDVDGSNFGTTDSYGKSCGYLVHKAGNYRINLTRTGYIPVTTFENYGNQSNATSTLNMYPISSPPVTATGTITTLPTAVSTKAQVSLYFKDMDSDTPLPSVQVVVKRWTANPSDKEETVLTGMADTNGTLNIGLDKNTKYVLFPYKTNYYEEINGVDLYVGNDPYQTWDIFLLRIAGGGQTPLPTITYSGGGTPPPGGFIQTGTPTPTYTRFPTIAPNQSGFSYGFSRYFGMWSELFGNLGLDDDSEGYFYGLFLTVLLCMVLGSRGHGSGVLAGAVLGTAISTVFGWYPIWIIIVVALCCALAFAKLYTSGGGGGGHSG